MSLNAKRYDEVLPANAAQVCNLLNNIKNLNPKDTLDVDVLTIMALIKRIELDNNK